LELGYDSSWELYTYYRIDGGKDEEGILGGGEESVLYSE
jgi:hypothetical protein